MLAHSASIHPGLHGLLNDNRKSNIDFTHRDNPIWSMGHGHLLAVASSIKDNTYIMVISTKHCNKRLRGKLLVELTLNLITTSPAKSAATMYIARNIHSEMIGGPGNNKSKIGSSLVRV